MSALFPRMRSQSIHDRCVQMLARSLSLEGWSVEAQAKGWLKPPYIDEYIPDIRARRGDDTRIIEVETEDTLNANISKHRKFHRSAKESRGTTFLLYMARDDGTCRLMR